MITPTVSAGQASSRPSSGKSDSSKSPATSSDEGDSEYISYSDGSSEGNFVNDLSMAYYKLPIPWHFSKCSLGCSFIIT